MRKSMVGRVLASALACAVTFGALASGRASAQDSSLKSLVTRFNAATGCQKAGISFGTITGTTSAWDTVGQVHKNGEAPREIRDDDVFEIGSITKTFTATLYALALNQQKVAAGDPGQQYMPSGLVLPNRVKRGNRTVTITLDDLARHASGLPRGVPSQNGSLPVEVMARETSSLELNSRPGARYLYSNLGFAILALAMQNVFHAPIETLLPDMVAVPLGMRSTVVAGSDWTGVLVGYASDDGTTARRGNATWPGFDGAGAILSTPKDMQIFLQYNMGLLANNRLNALRSRFLRTITLPVFGHPYRQMNMGLAWESDKLPNGREYFSKDGSVPGFRSYIAFTAPGSPQAGVVILTNEQGCKVIKLGRCVLETILGISRQDGYCANPQGAAEEEDSGD
jgi:CubicO group peptidase (beta-lactamase class C family)